MTGYLRGTLTDADGADELLATAAQAIPVARRLGITTLNLHGTGLGEGGLPVRPVEVVTGTMWLAAAATLRRVAALGEREGVTFVLENLNTAVDHPGTPFARAADCLALVEAVDSPHLKLMLDLYHAQIGEGNLIELIRRCGDAIGEIQVADVPGRCEPGTGEINYPAIARTLAELGYSRRRRSGGVRVLGLRPRPGALPATAFRPSDPGFAQTRANESSRASSRLRCCSPISPYG